MSKRPNPRDLVKSITIRQTRRVSVFNPFETRSSIEQHLHTQPINRGEDDN